MTLGAGVRRRVDLYVAVADLIPNPASPFFRCPDTVQQMVMIGLGVATVTLDSLCCCTPGIDLSRAGSNGRSASH